MIPGASSCSITLAIPLFPVGTVVLALAILSWRLFGVVISDILGLKVQRGIVHVRLLLLLLGPRQRLRVLQSGQQGLLYFSVTGV